MKSFPMKTTMASLALGLAQVATAFTPVTREDLFPSDILVDYGPGYDAQTENTIHQLAVSDFIFKGIVLATNDGFSAELNVEDAIWGCAPSSNITVRCVDPAIATSLVSNRQYLVLSYTNNWWADSSRSFSDNTLWHLCNYVSVTSRPPEHAVFQIAELSTQFTPQSPLTLLTTALPPRTIGMKPARSSRTSLTLQKSNWMKKRHTTCWMRFFMLRISHIIFPRFCGGELPYIKSCAMASMLQTRTFSLRHPFHRSRRRFARIPP